MSDKNKTPEEDYLDSLLRSITGGAEEEEIDENFIIETDINEKIDGQEQVINKPTELEETINENFDNMINKKIGEKPVLAIISLILGIIFIGSNPNVKMHASVLYPHEIWAKYAQELESVLYNRYSVSRRQSSNFVEMNNALEAMWQNLADLGNCGNTMVVVDGSGSMTVKNKYNIKELEEKELKDSKQINIKNRPEVLRRNREPGMRRKRVNNQQI